MPKVVSANRLADGIVVYIGPDGTWLEALGKAKIFETEAEAETGLLAARDDAKRNLILDPFVVEVAHDEAGLRAVSLRNAIRARGPTIDFTPRTGIQTARTERS
ncbi:DUF2849 domain-containing protein [Methylocapsa polymorpha]|uniref:DUF2849 domain-containing protein n=1 Tax=Methylocapsa polymorpha TaxID=3080828 RepID=A0ABZ0HTJ7_9HYPH|nr:DUF2849 domain-containing protein [Methylocapsa sp. RX1]